MRCRLCFSIKDVQLGVNGVPYCANCMPVPQTEPCGVTPTRSIRECSPPVQNGRCGICFRPLTEGQVDRPSARKVIEQRIQEARDERAELDKTYSGHVSLQYLKDGYLLHELESLLAKLDTPAEAKPYQMPVSAVDLGRKVRRGKVS